MTRWPLRIKVGAYATLLTAVTFVTATAALLTVIYFRQLRELDDELRGDATELVRDLQNFRGAPMNARRPLSGKFLRADLQDRYLMLTGPEGQVLFQSPNLGETNIEGEPGFREVVVNGHRSRVGTFRIGEFTVHVGIDLSEIDKLPRDVMTALLLTLPLIGLMVFAGGLWLGQKAVSPVAKLSEAAERISVENLDERLPLPPADDEIARLTLVLNDAFTRLQRSYETTARFSADASHQLKTPVAVLRSGLESLLDHQPLDDAGRDEVDNLLGHVRRLTSLIEDLLLLARTDARKLLLQRETFDLGELVELALDDLVTLLDERVEVEQELQRPVLVSGDRRHLTMIVQNLIENAGKYTPDRGHVRVTTTMTASEAVLSVANTGPALSESDREGIFERFRRGRDVGETQRGHGLGLNIARELARAHGGDLVLARSDGEWNEFVLNLPAAQSRPPAN
jgi:signal transduction histidine kinase